MNPLRLDPNPKPVLNPEAQDATSAVPAAGVPLVFLGDENEKAAAQRLKPFQILTVENFAAAVWAFQSLRVDIKKGGTLAVRQFRLKLAEFFLQTVNQRVDQIILGNAGGESPGVLDLSRSLAKSLGSTRSEEGVRDFFRALEEVQGADLRGGFTAAHLLQASFPIDAERVHFYQYFADPRIKNPQSVEAKSLMARVAEVQQVTENELNHGGAQLDPPTAHLFKARVWAARLDLSAAAFTPASVEMCREAAIQELAKGQEALDAAIKAAKDPATKDTLRQPFADNAFESLALALRVGNVDRVPFFGLTILEIQDWKNASTTQRSLARLQNFLGQLADAKSFSNSPGAPAWSTVVRPLMVAAIQARTGGSSKEFVDASIKGNAALVQALQAHQLPYDSFASATGSSILTMAAYLKSSGKVAEADALTAACEKLWNDAETALQGNDSPAGRMGVAVYQLGRASGEFNCQRDGAPTLMRLETVTVAGLKKDIASGALSFADPDLQMVLGNLFQNAEITAASSLPPAITQGLFESWLAIVDQAVERATAAATPEEMFKGMEQAKAVYQSALDYLSGKKQPLPTDAERLKALRSRLEKL